MKNAFRIHNSRCRTEEIFNKHLDYIKRNLDMVDEVCIMTEFSLTGYWPDYKENAVKIGKCIEAYRALGIERVGLNIMSTIGGHDEGWSVFPKADFQYMISKDGDESKSCLCYADEDYLNYIADRYRAYAELKPDFIWLDDDVRVPAHTFIDVCYCPGCINRFNQENGTDYDREQLVSAIAADWELRNRWDAFQQSQLENLASLIQKTVKGVDSRIEIGLQSIWVDGLDGLVEASGATMCRPGGGFYDENKPLELFQKAYSVGCQIKAYGKEIKDIQYEYEGLEFLPYNKSLHIVDLECTANLIYGCNGILYVNFTSGDRDELPQLIRKCQKKWETICQINEGAWNEGIYFPMYQTITFFQELGIPLATDLEHACAVGVFGDHWMKFDKQTLEKILQRHVFTNAAGIKCLQKLGYGEYCGAKVINIYDNGMAERFTDHPLNGEYAGYFRDGHMNELGSGTAYGFALEEGASSLANLETITYVPKEDCATYIYEASDGVRLAATGYLQRNRLRTEAKKEQLWNVFRWLSGDKMPLWYDRNLKVLPIMRKNDRGECLVMLTNAFLDDTEEFRCFVRGEWEFSLLNDDGSCTPIPQEIESGNTCIFIDNIKGWNYKVFIGKEAANLRKNH